MKDLFIIYLVEEAKSLMFIFFLKNTLFVINDFSDFRYDYSRKGGKADKVLPSILPSYLQLGCRNPTIDVAI